MGILLRGDVDGGVVLVLQAGGADDHGDSAVVAGLEPIAASNAGTVKSISTSGIGRRSEVIGRPMAPMPAISPASRAISAESGRSMAAIRSNALSAFGQGDQAPAHSTAGAGDGDLNGCCHAWFHLSHRRDDRVQVVFHLDRRIGQPPFGPLRGAVSWAALRSTPV